VDHLNRIEWESLTTADPPPLLERGRTDWVRLRLARDLHERYFHRLGLQALPAEYGPGPGTLVLASPFCVRAPRFLGKLADSGVPSDSSYEPDLPPHTVGEHLALSKGAWKSWTELLQATIEVLDLDGAHVQGHASCHHRSSRALYPVVFDVAILLASQPGGSWRDDVSFEWVRAASHAGSFASHLDVPHDHFGRYSAVYRSDWHGVLLRNDGIVTSWDGTTIDAGAAWRGGSSTLDIAQLVGPLAGFGAG
jgi:hypothetical protein